MPTAGRPGGRAESLPGPPPPGAVGDGTFMEHGTGTLTVTPAGG
jgi:hypothetical protein